MADLTTGININTSWLSGIQTMFRKEMRPQIEKDLVMDQFGRVINFELNMGGKKYSIFNTRKLAKIITNLEEGTVPTANTLSLDFQNMDVERYGDWLPITEESIRYPKQNAMQAAGDEQKLQGAESIDWRAMRRVAPFGYPLRSDISATYMKRGTVSAATTTAITAKENIGGATDRFNGGYIFFETGVLAGQVFEITDTTSAADAVFTIGNTNHSYMEATTPKAAVAGDAFIVAVGTGITSSLKVTSSNLKQMVAVLALYGQKRFTQGAAGGYFAFVASPEVQLDFMNESAWKDAYKFTDASNIRKGVAGEYGGLRVFQTQQLYRESAAGVQSDTGAVHRVMALGPKAYWRTKIKGDNTGLQVVIRQPKELGQALDMYFSRGWEATTGSKVVDARAIVSMMVGGSAISV